MGRDTIVGPGLAQLDLALIKDTKITERVRVQFRAESYNLFNHPQFGQPGNSIASSLKAAPGTPTGVTINAPNAAAGIISSIATNSTGRQISRLKPYSKQRFGEVPAAPAPGFLLEKSQRLRRPRPGY